MSTIPESPKAALCRRLRWKGMFVDVTPDPSLPSMSDGYCWCTHTMNCLGPDGKVAEKDACQKDRACYEVF